MHDDYLKVGYEQYFGLKKHECCYIEIHTNPKHIALKLLRLFCISIFQEEEP